MKIKMAAIDLDGTLLHDDMSLSDFSKDIIRKAEHRGVRIVLATGRMFDAARPKAEELGLSDTPLICYTGAWIMMSRFGRPICQDGIDISVAEKILLTARKKGWLVHTFFDDQIYLPEPNKTEAKYKKYRTKAVAYLGDAFYHPKKKPTRLIFADGSEAVRREIRRVIESDFQMRWRSYSREMISWMSIKKESAKGQRFKSCAICGIFLFLRSSLLVIQKMMYLC